MNALRILARVTGKSPGEVGTTTARPLRSSSSPVALSRGFTPERQTPLHSRHAALGAQFMLAGVWRRPEYYAQPGKSWDNCICKLRQFAPVSGLSMGDAGEIEFAAAADS